MGLYEAIRAVHILCGAIGLVSMFVPLVAKKGGRAHRRFGRIFAWAMAVSAIAGLLMGAAWLAVPAAFVEPELVGARRAAGLFFAALALLLLGSVQQMTGALRRKHQAQPRPTRLELGLPLSAIVVGATAAIVGAMVGRWLMIGFGTLTAMTAWSNLRFVRSPLPSPRAWWYQHMQGAMGSMIAGITAFAVFGGQRWLVEVVPPSVAWLPWVVPAAVLTPVFGVWTRSWRRRFGELPGRATRPVR